MANTTTSEAKWFSYLRRVKDHWVNLVTGGTITALVFVASLVTGYAIPSYLSLLLLGFFFFRAGYLVWREDRLRLDELESLAGKVRPNITVRLVVDSITEGNIYHHFQIKNVGELPVSDLLVAQIGDNFRGFEFQSPVPRSLPQHSEFSIDGGPTLSSGDAKILTVRVSYRSQIQGEERQFMTEVRFYISKHVQPSVLDPDGRRDLEGSYAEELIAGSTESLLEQLEKPQGTAYLILFKIKEDGKPNVSVAKVSRRLFVFDAERGIASFTTLTNNRKQIQLLTPLKESKSGKYLVVIAWDDESGGSLSVNRHTVEDFGTFREYDSDPEYPPK